MTGKVISLEFINTDLCLYMFPSGEGIHVVNTFDGNVNVRIRGTPVDMLTYLISTRGKSSTFSGTMEIIGDVGLAQHFQAILKNIDLDWEEHLSRRVGDSVAHKLGNVFRYTMKYAIETKRTLELDVSEYLRYEKEILPDRSEIAEYAILVDELRDDVERLKLRIERLDRAILSRP